MSGNSWLIDVVTLSSLTPHRAHLHSGHDSLSGCPTCKAASARGSPRSPLLPISNSDVKSHDSEYVELAIRRVRVGIPPPTPQVSRLKQINWGTYGYISWFIGITASCILILMRKYALSLVIELIFFPAMLIFWSIEIWVRGWKEARFGLDFARRPTTRTTPVNENRCQV